MLRILSAVPKFTVTALIVLAIVNLLVGVILRYFVGAITDWLDVDPVQFTWVEEVGELSLAWLTLIGAAIGIQSRADHGRRLARRMVRLQALPAQPHAHDARPRNQSRLALRVFRGRRHPDRRLRLRDDDLPAAARRAPALRRTIHAACDCCHRLRCACPALDAD